MGKKYKKIKKLKLEKSLYTALKAYQEQHHLKSPKAAIPDILQQTLQSQQIPGEYASQAQVKRLEKEVLHLFELVGKLTETIANQSRQPEKQPFPQQVEETAEDEEEVYDEPDEILYDFLEPGN
ncbi:MAG: hypothetical protein SAJ12_01005 [Jaaginema sp. PMC 1079.18]|nr:hypothetical protein [Jaaginema sp. PMC 1080.18]MEC4849563.1 hypothetical protein [Jaaginema sp. PMC 1079.18]MEC4868640.1 hypothetical protein [Jaaginema sp. PMC 1078.18]